MEVKLSRELKSPRHEVATIEISWNPQDRDEDNYVATIAAVTDMAIQLSQRQKDDDKSE